MSVSQVRSVSRKAAALRAAQSQLAAAEADKATKEGKLTKAKEAQVGGVCDTRAASHNTCCIVPSVCICLLERELDVSQWAPFDAAAAGEGRGRRGSRGGCSS